MAQLGFSLATDATAQENGYDRYSTTLGETLGAVAGENWNFNPISSIGTYRSVLQAERDSLKNNIDRVDRKELNKEYSDLGLYFDEDEYQSVVDIMVSEKKEERRRQSIISRGPEGSWNPFSGGFYVGAAKFGVGLAVSMTDLINIGASFIPIVGQARFAQLAARTGLRTARLTRGIAEGAFGAALVEPIVYSTAQRVQADYDLRDSFMNITFGSILGGGLHVGVGKIRDINTARKFKNFRAKVNQSRKDLNIKSDEIEPELNLYKEYFPENGELMLRLEKTDPRTRKLLLQKSLGDLMSEKPVDTSAVVNADPILRSTPESTAVPEVTPRPRPSIDEVELNTVEKNVSNKTPVERDADIDLLSSQLDALKINQEPLKLKFADEAEVKRTKEELDEVNNKSKELDEAITDFINCRNGR
tara:strand:+ start:51 stop:1304 length:1254 start_codon:yes stop_codon:yes gene_type:complete